MADESFTRAFAAFDREVEPDPAFAAALYERLASDLGFRERPAADRRLGARLARLLVPGSLPVGRQALRLAWMAVLLGLLLALALGAALVGRVFWSRPAPDELVMRSKTAYAVAPPMRMEVRDPEGLVYELTTDGTGTWLVDPPDEREPGSWYLYDGTRVGYYDAAQLTWGFGPAEERFGPPYPFGTNFTWTLMTGQPNPDPIECAGAAWIAEEQVAGRPAQRIYCPDMDMDFWIDTETAILLRIEAGPNAPGWDPNAVGLAPVIEAITVEVGPVDETRFDWDGPPGAYSEDAPPASTILEDGQAPPRWTGATLGGGSFDSAAVTRPTLVVLWSPECEDACQAVVERVAGQDEPRAAVEVVVVVVGDSLELEPFLERTPIRATIVPDAGWTLFDAWGITAFPSLVALDAGGRVALVYRGPMAVEDLDRLLPALADGTPIPSIAPLPAE